MKGLDRLKMATLAGGMALAAGACDADVSNESAVQIAALTAQLGDCYKLAMIDEGNVVCQEVGGSGDQFSLYGRGANGWVNKGVLATDVQVPAWNRDTGELWFGGNKKQGEPRPLTRCKVDLDAVQLKECETVLMPDGTEAQMTNLGQTTHAFFQKGVFYMSSVKRNIDGTWTSVPSPLVDGCDIAQSKEGLKRINLSVDNTGKAWVVCNSAAKQYTYLAEVEPIINGSFKVIPGTTKKGPCGDGFTTAYERFVGTNGTVEAASCNSGLVIVDNTVVPPVEAEPDVPGDTTDDTVPDSTDANDIGPGEVDAVGDAVPDGVDTDDNGSTEDVKPDLSQPDAEVQELPQEEVSSPDGETDNGQEVVADVTTEDGDGGEGPDVVEVSETDVTNGTDATPDVIVRNVCAEIGARSSTDNGIECNVETLSNGSCAIITREVKAGVEVTCRLDFGDGGHITVKTKQDGVVGEIDTITLPGQVGGGTVLAATSYGQGQVVGGGVVESIGTENPIAEVRLLPLVGGGGLATDVAIETSQDGVITAKGGKKSGARILGECKATGQNVVVDLEAGASTVVDPCAEIVKPPVEKPSSGGGCEAGGEGNHSNGVGGAVGAVLIAGLLAAYNRRKQLFGGAKDNNNKKVA